MGGGRPFFPPLPNFFWDFNFCTRTIKNFWQQFYSLLGQRKKIGHSESFRPYLWPFENVKSRFWLSTIKSIGQVRKLPKLADKCKRYFFNTIVLKSSPTLYLNSFIWEWAIFCWNFGTFYPFFQYLFSNLLGKCTYGRNRPIFVWTLLLILLY